MSKAPLQLHASRHSGMCCWWTMYSPPDRLSGNVSRRFVRFSRQRCASVSRLWGLWERCRPVPKNGAVDNNLFFRAEIVLDKVHCYCEIRHIDLLGPYQDRFYVEMPAVQSQPAVPVVAVADEAEIIYLGCTALGLMMSEYFYNLFHRIQI